MSSNKLNISAKSQPLKEIPKEDLLQQLSQLSPTQFNWVIFYLRIPKSSLPSPIEPQSKRATAILQYAEQTNNIINLPKIIAKSISKAPSLELSGAQEQSSSRGIAVVAIIAVSILSISSYFVFFKKSNVCGNNIIEPGETCDDGNRLSNDGCTESCISEAKTALEQKNENQPTPPTTNASILITSTQPESNPATISIKEDTTSKPTTSPSASAKLETQTIYFESASDVFYSNSFNTLDLVADILTKNPQIIIRLEGHTDSDGSTAKNFSLSKKRAEVVREYLKTKGISQERLKVVSCGAIVPLAKNTNEAGRRQNRRVEIIDAIQFPENCQKEKP